MRRYLSIWIPDWSISRHYQQASPRTPNGAPSSDDPGHHPFALVTPAQGGIRIMAANRAARRAGILIDQTLADARALCPVLKIADHDPAADQAALERLALWCIRYTPWVASQPPDGLCLDMTGGAHLFGGEAALTQTLQDQLARMGLASRIAIAKTIGAAWALARHGTDSITIAPDGQTATALAPLPVNALRITMQQAERLEQVGLKTIGALLGKPRAPLAARYGMTLVNRLDQALGQKGETLSPITAPPDYRTYLQFPEPLLLLDQIRQALARLAQPLCDTLRTDGIGARAFTLSLYRVDGHVRTIPLRTGSLCRDTDHLCRLFAEALNRLQEDYDAGFGIEHIVLNAFATETARHRQPRLDDGPATEDAAAFRLLLDRYGNRLGFENIHRPLPQHSHIPERAEQWRPLSYAGGKTECWRDFVQHLQGGDFPGRPIILLPRPEPVAAIAAVPDGPPLRFEWRRLEHRVHKAEGPERIAPEWWGRPRAQAALTRDYFRIEDVQGYRFWLFRLGLYERGENPRWFLHGIFS